MLPITNPINHHSYAIDTMAQRPHNTPPSASIETIKPAELLNHKFELIHVIVDGQVVELANRISISHPFIKFRNVLAQDNILFPNAKEDDLFLIGKVDNTFSGPLSHENGILKARMLITTQLRLPGNLLEDTIASAFREGITVSQQEGTLILRSSTTELVYKQS